MPGGPASEDPRAPTPSEPRDRPRAGEWAVAALLSLLALALRVPLLDRGFEYDELWTTIDFIEADTLRQTLSRLGAFNNHVFYSLCARASEALLGRAEWVVRLPALLFGVASVPAAWWVFRRSVGPPAASFAAAALATSAVHVGFSASARGYTAVVLFTLLAGALFLRVIRDGAGVRTAAALAVATALALFTHLQAAGVVAAQGALVGVLAWRARRRADGLAVRRARAAALALAAGVGLAALCYAPMLRAIVARLLEGGSSPFRPALPFEVLSYLSGHYREAGGAAIAAAALAGLALGLRGRPVERGYVALLFLLPLLGVWLARPEFVRPRFFLFLLPTFGLGAVLAVGCLFRALAPRSRAAAVGAAGAAAAALAWGWASAPWSNVPTGGFREAAAALEAAPARAGERVGTCAIGIGARFYAWYAEGPVFVPESLAGFEAFAKGYDEVRCAWMAHPAEPAAHTQVGRLLEEKALSARQRFFVIRVYRYRPDVDGEQDVTLPGRADTPL